MDTAPSPPPTSLPATGSGPDAAAAATLRRRALPSGRAVLGGLLVTLAALGAFVFQNGGGDEPGAEIVVAARPISPGERIGADSLETVPLDLPRRLASVTFRDPAELDGAVALAPLAPGELLQRSGIVTPAVGEDEASPPVHELSLAIDRDRALDGALSPGERIDLVATLGTGETAATDVVVQDVTVVAVGDRDDAIGAAGTVTLTLAISNPDDVVAAAHAADVGVVRVVRATKSGPGE